MSFEEIADELYGLPLNEFVTTRDARSAEARQSKNRQLANELKALAKPTLGAWAVNQLLRQARPLLLRLMNVGQGLRDAQARMDAQQLRDLSSERRELTARVTAELRLMSLSDAAEQEALDTLAAGVSDPIAAEQVLAGRVSRGLEPGGFGEVVAARPAEPAPESSPLAASPELAAEPDPLPPEPVLEQTRQPERPAIEPPPPSTSDSSLRLLQRKLDRAREDLDEARADQEDARERVQALRQRLALAKEKLRAADDGVEKAEAALEELQNQIDEL